jgi:AraC family transcriptional regulator of adaptative response/methylated-DNA-[protein]-cysteine methyltransferase
MLAALARRDTSYEGIFVVCVTTTGIFCRPGCGARLPRPEHVEFVLDVGEALRAGYRPCARCRPTEPAGAPPGFLRDLLRRVEEDPSRRWRDHDLRDLGLEPDRVRRWFQRHHGMSFHAYSRARRLGIALGHIRAGQRVTDAALDSGYESLAGFHEAFGRWLGGAPRATAGATVVTVTRIVTPLGPMVAGATGGAVCLLEFDDRRMLLTQLRRLEARLGCSFLPGNDPHLAALARELEAYFAGRCTEFTVPVTTPGTPFQRAVWERLREIPYGKTTSYGALARALGQPEARRAVARANGDNRVAILVPCHRVVGQGGALTGYGGGLWRKRRLLDLEGAGGGKERRDR